MNYVILLHSQTTKQMKKLTEIKIGDLVLASYKYGSVCGIVKKINKNTIVVNRHWQKYNTYTASNVDLNITISRIYDINPDGFILN